MSTKPSRIRISIDANDRVSLYASVSIGSEDAACAAARDLAGKRYLVTEAPPLPLPECDAQQCTCGYFNYRDRRSFLSNRRAVSRLASVAEKPYPGENRREGADRRSLRVTAVTARPFHWA